MQISPTISVHEDVWIVLDLPDGSSSFPVSPLFMLVKTCHPGRGFPDNGVFDDAYILPHLSLLPPPPPTGCALFFLSF